MDAVTLLVRRARAEEIFPLRHAVLRPGRPVTASVYAQDAGAVHIGAWATAPDGDGDELANRLLVGCASVFPEPWAGSAGYPAEPAAWRLRGMAVDPSRHRGGVGRQVLAAVVEAAREGGAPLIWANARTSALPFYEAQGWVVVGEEFIAPDSGLPHKPIVVPL